MLRQILFSEYSCMKSVSPQCLFGVAVTAFITTSLDGWLSYHVASKAKNIFYCTRLCESITLFCLLHVALFGLKRGAKKTTWSISSKLSNNWQLLSIYSLVIFITNNDYMQVAKTAGGSEYMQTAMALSIPAVILWNNYISSSEIKGCTVAILLISSTIQVIILCKDKTFSSSISSPLLSLVFATFYGLYFVLIKRQLLKEQIFHLMYLLIFCQIPLFLTLAIFNDETRHFLPALLHMHRFNKMQNIVFIPLFMVVISFLKMISMLLLMKISGPLLCLASSNLSMMPIALVHAFIYKLGLHLATFKLFFLILLNSVVAFLKDRKTTFPHRNSEEIIGNNEGKYQF